MQLKELKSRLSNKRGSSFLYRGEQVRLIDWEIKGEDCTIKFENRQLKMPVASVPALLRELLPVEEPGVESANTITDIVKAAPPALPLQATNVLAEANTMLLDAMRKVQGNPSYINQARSMSEVAQVIVNSAKTQVAAAAIILKAQGNNGSHQ